MTSNIEFLSVAPSPLAGQSTIKATPKAAAKKPAAPAATEKPAKRRKSAPKAGKPARATKARSKPEADTPKKPSIAELSEAKKALAEKLLPLLGTQPQTVAKLATQVGADIKDASRALQLLLSRGEASHGSGNGWVGMNACNAAISAVDSALFSNRRPTNQVTAAEHAPDVFAVTRIEGGSGIAEHTQRGRIIKFGPGHKSANDAIGNRSTTVAQGISSVAYNAGLAA